MLYEVITQGIPRKWHFREYETDLLQERASPLLHEGHQYFEEFLTSDQRQPVLVPFQAAVHQIEVQRLQPLGNRPASPVSYNFV